MRRHILAVLLLALAPFLLSCGGPSVVRDAQVYETELGFWEAASLQTATALKGFIAEYCVCEEGVFTTEMCEKAAKKALVVETRVPYHKAMALYNAQLLKKRPSKTPPVVPATSTLCPQVSEEISFIHEPSPHETEIFFGLVNEPLPVPDTEIALTIW